MYIFKNVEKNRCLEDQGTRAEWQNAWNNNAASTFSPAFVKDDPVLSNIKKNTSHYYYNNNNNYYNNDKNNDLKNDNTTFSPFQGWPLVVLLDYINISKYFQICNETSTHLYTQGLLLLELMIMMVVLMMTRVLVRRGRILEAVDRKSWWAQRVVGADWKMGRGLITRAECYPPLIEMLMPNRRRWKWWWTYR